LGAAARGVTLQIKVGGFATQPNITMAIQ